MKCPNRKGEGPRSGLRLCEVYFKAHLFHLQKRFGVAAGVVNGVVGVFGFAEVLEVYEGVFLQALVE